mmetsp:Transcript_11513/g.16000  ORF Transcript_11513/g.16000 Transcript_11513/m.16000 type:complete len:238 (+) Transcript_11513:96-809(+)
MKQRTFRTWTLVPEYRNKIRNKWIEPPVWYEAAQAHPPPYTYGYQRKGGKAKVIVFPEDKLKKQFLAKNPWAKHYRSRQFPNQNIYIDSPADVFAAKHIELTNQGVPEAKAYDKALNYVEEMMYSLRLEKQLATEQVNAKQPFAPTSNSDDAIDLVKYKYQTKFENLRVSRMRKTVEQVIRRKKFNKDTTPLTAADMEGVPRDQIDTYLDMYPEDSFYFRLLDEEDEGQSSETPEFI